MQSFYRVLEIDGELIHDYKSLYYDTDEESFILITIMVGLIEIKFVLESM